MALKFRLIERNVTIGKHAGRKLFFAQQVAQNKLTFAKLCDVISEGSTVSSADVKAVIDRLAHAFRHYLSEGFIVDCGELGSFRPSFGSQGVERIEDFKVHKHLRKARVRYMPPRNFSALRLASYQRIDELANKPETGAPSTPDEGKKPTPPVSGEDTGEGI